MRYEGTFGCRFLSDVDVAGERWDDRISATKLATIDIRVQGPIMVGISPAVRQSLGLVCSWNEQ